MNSDETILDFSAAEFRDGIARGESEPGEERQQSIARDPDRQDAAPLPKQLLSLRLDRDVLQWFRDQGPGYQTRINAALRNFVQDQGKPRA